MVDSSDRGAQDVFSARAEGHAALSPVMAFAVVAVLLGAGAGVLLALRGPEAPAPQPAATPAEPDLSLTESEAIARFQELDALRLQAYRTRDLFLLRMTFVSSSPLIRRAQREIRQLLKDKVLARPSIEEKRLIVKSIDPSVVVLLQTVDLDVKFVSENGEDVTEGQGLERQVIRWTMKPAGDQWMLFDAVIRSARSTRAQP